MKLPEKIELAKLPTKIEKLERFTKYMDLPVELYIKRDDETGIFETGNKIRKLEYVAAYALKNGYDTLVTCGGTQSNHARTTAYVATKMGMDSYLILKGKKPQVPDGNYLLDLLFGAEIKWITQEEYNNNLKEIFTKVEEELKKKNKRPLIIPEGASYTLGMFGYIEAAGEIKSQIRSMKVNMDYIVSSVGSGGTLAGFLVGQNLYSLDTKMYGINVCDNKEFFTKKILLLIEEFRHTYPEFKDFSYITREDINIIDGYVGEGYGIPYKEEIEIIKKLARLEGIVLDPTYTGKAFYGMIEEIKKGTFGSDSKILFVHTGGIYGLFPQKEYFLGD